MTFLKALIIIGLLSSAAHAQDKSQTHILGMKHSGQMNEDALPKESGQSAFAAIQEIVAMLEVDPKTDWAKVDIETLRQHLIDMNNVTLNTVVTANEAGDGIAFSVVGEVAVIGSIQRMIKAHVATMNGADGWTLSAEMIDNGAVLKVTPPDQASMAKLRALGFIGVMAQGMHHQQHHWMLANGMTPHK